MAEAWYSALAHESANGVSATEAVGAVLGGPAGAAMAGASAAARMAAAAGGGGSWSFDPEEIDAVIGEWKALLEELEADRAQVNSIVDALAVVPSEDTPTLGYVRALLDGVAGLEDSNFSMNEYVAEFVRKLEDAKKTISSTDQSSSEAFGSGEVETV
ncbi:hypothetical protein [Saccharomonospora azurea]|uniref:Uncharacterized protein n=1 Tax=Saccharomonospora azurea NA-128 TaxID=882081 RepID=H8GCB6_9PSEU|nr:hypothetical protein [Saccharomonospora azurea]EHY88750.1 hypothetical protein SacazDRAFT_01832 [Saccharomonospora azurea NA-128]